MKHHSLKPSTSSVLLAGQEAWRICCYYVAELHTLAIFCNFEATLNKMLRDRLVAGSATCKFADGSRERLELCQSTRDCAKLGSSWEKMRRHSQTELLRKLLRCCSTRCQDRNGKTCRKLHSHATGVGKATIQQPVVASRRPSVTNVGHIRIACPRRYKDQWHWRIQSVCHEYSRWPFLSIPGGSPHWLSANFHGAGHRSFAVYHVCSNIWPGTAYNSKIEDLHRRDVRHCWNRTSSCATRSQLCCGSTTHDRGNGWSYSPGEELVEQSRAGVESATQTPQWCTRGGAAQTLKCIPRGLGNLQGHASENTCWPLCIS